MGVASWQRKTNIKAIQHTIGFSNKSEKNSLQRCASALLALVEKTEVQRAHHIPGRTLRTARCITVTLTKVLCLFRKLLGFLLSAKHFRKFFSCSQSKHSWNNPQWEHACDKCDKCLSLPWSGIPHHVTLWDLLDSCGLEILNKSCKNKI